MLLSPLVVEVDRKWKPLSYRFSFEYSQHVTFKSVSVASGSGGEQEMKGPVMSCSKHVTFRSACVAGDCNYFNAWIGIGKRQIHIIRIMINLNGDKLLLMIDEWTDGKTSF